MNTSSHDTTYNIVQSLAPVAVIFFIFGIIAFAVAIAYVVRLWLVQTATLEMREDLRDIRNYLLKPEEEESKELITSGEVLISDEEKDAILSEHYKVMKPRRPFIWLALAIPVLLIVLTIILKLG